jgi:hypothetical protein
MQGACRLLGLRRTGHVVVDQDDDVAGTQRLGQRRGPGGAAGDRGRGQIERGDTVGVLFALAEKYCRVRKL